MKNIKFVLFFLAGTLAFASCHHAVEEAPKTEQFCLSDTMVKNVVISDVDKQTVHSELTLSGKVTADADKSVKVYPLVSGHVEQLKVQLGDHVEKGQVLAVIRSSEIADYDNQLIAARSNLAVATKGASAAEEMYKAGLMSEKEYISAKNDLEKAQGEMNRIEQTMKVYGSGKNSMYNIVAPVSGFIVEKNATEGMQYKLESAGNFFTISNLDEVWVIASVFESDISKIKEGFDADITFIAFPGKPYKGKVDRLFTTLDPDSRVMKVRIRIPNKGYQLKPEMFAQIKISYDAGNLQMPAIPAHAVIFDHNKNYVMVYKDKCHIETRQIELSQTTGDVAYIKSGLQVGEKIISQYQLLVYDALND